MLGLLGFRKEEPNHALVAVEEPEDAALTGETIHQYNVKKTKHDVDLCDLFVGDGIKARLGTLSHSHCMLVLRAWINCCLWSIPYDEVQKITFCDQSGRLSQVERKDHENFKEMIEMIKEGMWVEILDAKIDKEEPGAASSISWALNEGNSIALATTEISAMAVLSGEIIVQQSRDLGQMVAFIP